MVTMRGTQLMTPLTHFGPDRDALRRTGDGILDAGEDARYLVTRAGSVSLREGEGGRLELALETRDPRIGVQNPLVYLGRLDGMRIIAAEDPEPGPELEDPGREMHDIRQVAPRLDPVTASYALTASAMATWHRTTRFCPACGALLEPTTGGWVLRCTVEGSEHFPRTDAAVIMGVRDGQDRLLLARNAAFRSRFHSVLAGFVEPGETLENAVVREVHEEVSLAVTELEYIGSQPWPFPRSLMIGYRAWVADPERLRLQDGELAEARWFSREELAAALADGEIEVPAGSSIGRALIEDWYGGELPAA
ncbi:NAD(+) diphosphatase [Brachybacterium hainanense]|uniref:NAD(+) diphosphatase n=1 Tax=Brachybacterium hainanense TaxID=1541174 RepID=A0ABV6RFG2_9MICO